MVRPSDIPASQPEWLHPSRAAPPLDTQVSYRFGVPLIYVSGELDHGSAGRLRQVVEEELGAGPVRLLLEFSRVAYMDSGGLSLLFEAVKKVGERGWLGLVAPNQNVRKLVEMTGLIDQKGFRIIENLETLPAMLGEPSRQPGGGP